jgi:hypothetical protein
MNIIGIEFVQRQLNQPGYFFKVIMNDSCAAFFDRSTQHRTVKFAGLSYEDNHQGNAIAAIVTDTRIEIRKHASFTEGRGRSIIRSLLEHPDVSALRAFSVTYQGKNLE